MAHVSLHTYYINFMCHFPNNGLAVVERIQTAKGK